MFFVTVLNLEGKTELTNSRTMGYFVDFSDAETSVLTNDLDIHECCYQYAVIEDIPPKRLYPLRVSEVWFQWDEEADAYKPCTKPEQLKHIVNFGIG